MRPRRSQLPDYLLSDIGVLRGEQEQNLRLKGIRVLEFVDQKVREASLKVAPDRRFFPKEVASLDQEVEEIELSGARFERFIRLDQAS